MEQLFGARIRMEQLFGARIRARIKQLFGARIRDPKGTAFRGPNRGPNRTTFRGPGLLAVDVSPGALWRPPFQSAHLCPPAIFSGLEWYTTFRARIWDPNGTAFRGPNRGPNRTTFRGPWMFLQRLFGCHCFNLHICVHQPSFRSPNGIRLFGPEWNSFSIRAPHRTTFRRGSLEATVSICTFVSTSHLFGAQIRDPNKTAFRGPNRGPNRTTFRGPGLLAVDVPPGALWRPPFQSAHLCPPAIFSGPEWNDFLGPEPSARMVVFSCGA